EHATDEDSNSCCASSGEYSFSRDAAAERVYALRCRVAAKQSIVHLPNVERDRQTAAAARRGTRLAPPRLSGAPPIAAARLLARRAPSPGRSSAHQRNRTPALSPRPDRWRRAAFRRRTA